MTTHVYQTKFPLYKRGDQNWESLLELLDRYRLHKNGYTSTSYYQEQETMTIGMEGEDIPWCCKYKKETFVDAWDKVQNMVENWHSLDDNGVGSSDHLVIPSLVYRRKY